MEQAHLEVSSIVVRVAELEDIGAKYRFLLSKEGGSGMQVNSAAYT